MSKKYSLTFKIKSNTNEDYSLKISNKEENIIFFLENLKDFPVNIFERKIPFQKLNELDENFNIFRNSEKLFSGIKSCIESGKYSLEFNEKKNFITFGIKNDFFENGIATIQIPQKEQDLNTQINSLNRIVSELKEELKKVKSYEISKQDAAIKSFKGTSILKDDDKILISKWIHPNKVITFNMLFDTNRDGDSSSTFHYYCDGVFPTVTVVKDTNGRIFGGYSTQNWCQSSVGANYARAPGSFIFNISNKKKYDLVEEIDGNAKYAIYRNNSYGPVFGGNHDLCIANSCKSNTSSYIHTKHTYNTEKNLFGGEGQVTFQISSYEVYQVIFE